MATNIYLKCKNFFTKYHRVFTYLFYISALAIYIMELTDPDAFDILISASQKNTIEMTAGIVLGIVCAGSALENGNKKTLLLNSAFWLLAIYYWIRNDAFALPFTIALITGAWGASDRTALLPLMPGSIMMFDQWQLKVVGFVKHDGFVFSKDIVLPLLFLSLYAFIWYVTIRNHSIIHASMTYRNLAVTAFGLPAAMISCLKEGQ